jgi:curved DNA-binding protein CbpA
MSFDKLKFNLYEILNVSQDASEKKIKKAFKNLVLHFHPDKGNKIEEDIFEHILLANEILTNEENRRKYDDFINNKTETFFDMRKNFEKQKNNYTPGNKDDAIKYFKNKFQELEKMHLENSSYESKDPKKYLEERENDIHIPFEKFNTNDEFNKKFEDRITSGHFSDQLIPVEEKMHLSTNFVSDTFTGLDVAFNNLYVEGGGISTSNFSSLDTAFKLQPLNKKIKESSPNTGIVYSYKDKI